MKTLKVIIKRVSLIKSIILCALIFSNKSLMEEATKCLFRTSLRSTHSGQLSLAIPPWVGAMNTSLGWEVNRGSGVALAMRHRQ